ncbi:DNA cytosine methyltransferase [Mycobacterium colombiense]|nr:DNA cytosine methyltransferase [Mycobacterium colombiense]
MVAVLRTLDLFAGAGGLSLGFEQSGLGFESISAIEIDPAAARTFKRNFGCPVFDLPIQKIDQFDEAEIILGGPPCQGFSPLGRDQDKKARAQLNNLWRHYFRAVRQIMPRAFVIENVPEFQKSAQFHRLLAMMKSDKKLREYGVGYGVLNAADYGVPQRRRRGIFVAVRGSNNCLPWPPAPTHGPESPERRPYRTVRDV